MDKKFASTLSVYSHLDLDSDPGTLYTPDYVFEDTELYNVIQEIFSVDPVSGFPIGDLSYYLSPSGNPQVKQWLENNLLQPRVKSNGSSLSDVTDDLIFECSRKRDESVLDYSHRLAGIRDSALQEYLKLLDSKSD